MRVLVVDDCADNARLIGLFLRHRGHEVELARDGAEAMARAVADRPGAVLLDLGLPDRDGVEVAHALRAAGLAAVLVAVSGRRLEPLDPAFDAQFTKPVDLDALADLLAGSGPVAGFPRADAPPAV
jgi:DNA-binding response OmpR family regulator